ncbi:ISAs1 family transposase [Streptomyces sp. NPDC040750]|uniref:ISAs1 family transposase n=1 Tax=Streptomyces sp. NPDC040750 TaxID=3154491 RepID=UPI0033F3EA48
MSSNASTATRWIQPSEVGSPGANAPPARRRTTATGGPCPPSPWTGKTERGARRTDGTQVHLLAAMTGIGLVTAQREVDATTNEITVFQPLLAPLNLHGTVVTFDALHSQTAHARFLVEDKHAHYIALIKGNQPTLHQWLKALPWREVPLLDKTRATAHGRDEIRRIKAAAVAGIAFPHAVQAVQIVRRRRIATTGKVTLERIYGVTDLTAEQADATEIARRVRGHWGIENKIHHVRDTTYAEERTLGLTASSCSRAFTRTIPAGEQTAVAMPPGRPVDHPRGRREQDDWSCAYCDSAGPSPRARGAAPPGRGGTAAQGPSPRVRGAADPEAVEVTARGTIPADAGVLRSPPISARGPVLAIIR